MLDYDENLAATLLHVVLMDTQLPSLHLHHFRLLIFICGLITLDLIL